ncbi:HypC/HybG/HupF family hydrogenase formation chaperone [Sessilibacter sp. MAH4]
MCIGIPMQVVSVDGNRVMCLRYGETDDSSKEQLVDASLVESLHPGQWLLVFLNAAREIISPERADQVGKALSALMMVDRGDSSAFDHLFEDLNREPQLPAHLQALLKK